MRPQPPPAVDVLPDHQYIIFLQIDADGLRREMLADGSAMLVIKVAARLVENFPSPPPCAVGEIGVFQVERLKERVKPAHLQKFFPVIGRGAASGVEGRKRHCNAFVDDMADSQKAFLEFAADEEIRQSA